MSRDAYKKAWFVFDSERGYPVANQPAYTLNEAVARYNREVAEATKLFPDVDKREIESWFEIRNIKTGERAL